MQRWIWYSCSLCLLSIGLTACSVKEAAIRKDTADITATTDTTDTTDTAGTTDTTHTTDTAEQKSTVKEHENESPADKEQTAAPQSMIRMSGTAAAANKDYILSDSSAHRYSLQKLRQLSPEQRDNINSLTFLEQQAKIKRIVKENQGRELYLLADSSKSPQIIVRGSYYEVTKGQILADTRYPLSLMTGKGIGDMLKIDGNNYQITDISDWSSGQGHYIGLKDVSGENTGADYALIQNNSNDYYTLVSDADTAKDVLYSGSLYFSKDCTVEVNDPGDGYMRHSISAADLFTNDHDMIGAQFGRSSEGLDLWGHFKIDSSGLIISYSEIFVS